MKNLTDVSKVLFKTYGDNPFIHEKKVLEFHLPVVFVFVSLSKRITLHLSIVTEVYNYNSLLLVVFFKVGAWQLLTFTIRNKSQKNNAHWSMCSEVSNAEKYKQEMFQN